MWVLWSRRQGFLVGQRRYDGPGKEQLSFSGASSMAWYGAWFFLNLGKGDQR